MWAAANRTSTTRGQPAAEMAGPDELEADQVHPHGSRDRASWRVPAASGRDLLLCRGNCSAAWARSSRVCCCSNWPGADVLAQSSSAPMTPPRPARPAAAFGTVGGLEAAAGRRRCWIEGCGSGVRHRVGHLHPCPGRREVGCSVAGKLSVAPGRTYRLTYTFSGSRSLVPRRPARRGRPDTRQPRLRRGRTVRIIWSCPDSPSGGPAQCILCPC